MTRWCETGLSPEEFWRSTPRTILAALRGYYRRRGWLAWHVAALGRMKTLPSLNDLTGEGGAARAAAQQQSAAQMLHNFKLWKAVLA